MTDTEGQPAAGATSTAPDPNAPPMPPANPAPVPANIIPADLPHPVTQGPPLARGAKYQHHFVVDLISNGKRLWAVASAEGQKVLAEIRGEVTAEADKIEAHQAAGAAAQPAAADPNAKPQA